MATKSSSSSSSSPQTVAGTSSSKTTTTLKVLGVGLPRTGTASLKAALEILLQEPCYHMFEVFNDASKGKEWQRIFKEIESGSRQPGFESTFKGYGASVDAPASEAWPWILEEYPDVKVILTHRPGKDWKKSMDNTIMKLVPLTPFPNRLIAFWIQPVYQQFTLAADYLIPFWKRTYGDPLDESYMEKRIQEVKAGIPSDQLLDYALGSGWEPLCKFLDRPVPNVPFPRVNDKDDFGRFVKRQLLKAAATWVAVIAATVVLGVKLAA